MPKAVTKPLERTIYDFYDIVPDADPARWPWPEYPNYLGRFGLVRMLGHLPTPKPQDLPNILDIQLPEIPSQAGYEDNIPRPFVYIFDRVVEAVERMRWEKLQTRQLLFLMDGDSAKKFLDDNPAIGDDTFGGNAMYGTLAISYYAGKRLRDHYVSSAGAGGSTLLLVLTKR